MMEDNKIIEQQQIAPAQEPQNESWAPGTEEQLPAELAQMQAIQKEAEENAKLPQELQNTQVSTYEPKAKKSPQESFSELKRKAERIERERDEAMRRLKEMETRSNAEPDEDLSVNIAPDELAEGKHLSKVQKKIYKLEQQVKQHQQQTLALTVESQLKSQYPDFDKVVTKENIEALQTEDPILWQAISQSPDLYSKGATAYKLIKKFGFAPEDNYVKDRLRAQENAAKPRPLTSISPQQAESPLSRVNAFSELTPDLEKQLRKEMAEAIKNR